MGSLAAGGAAAMGTGAISQFNGNRTMDTAVQSDDNGYLRLAPNPNDANGGYAYFEANQLALDFDGEGNNDAIGLGPNVNAVTDVHNVFIIENKGTKDLDVWITDGGASNVLFYRDSDPSTPVEGQGNAQTLSPGDSMAVGVQFDLTGVTSTGEISPAQITVHAAEP